MLSKYPQHYNIPAFFFNSQQVGTAEYKKNCVMSPLLVYTCLDFLLFRVVRPYIENQWNILFFLMAYMKLRGVLSPKNLIVCENLDYSPHSDYFCTVCSCTQISQKCETAMIMCISDL